MGGDKIQTIHCGPNLNSRSSAWFCPEEEKSHVLPLNLTDRMMTNIYWELSAWWCNLLFLLTMMSVIMKWYSCDSGHLMKTGRPDLSWSESLIAVHLMIILNVECNKLHFHDLATDSNWTLIMAESSCIVCPNDSWDPHQDSHRREILNPGHPSADRQLMTIMSSTWDQRENHNRHNTYDRDDHHVTEILRFIICLIRFSRISRSSAFNHAFSMSGRKKREDDMIWRAWAFVGKSKQLMSQVISVRNSRIRSLEWP